MNRFTLLRGNRWKLASIFGAGIVVSMLLHGMLPGQAASFNQGFISGRFMISGALECGAVNTGILLTEGRCPLVGGEAGGIYSTNYPIVVTGSLLLKLLPWLGAEGVITLLGCLVMTLTIFSAYKLARIMRVRSYLAVLAGPLYLATPIVIGMQNFGGTYWGTLLLPVWIFGGVAIVDKIYQSRGTHTHLAVLLASWILLNTASLFTDGYTYVMSQLAVGMYVLIRVYVAYRTKWSWLVSFLFIGVNGVAYLLYKRYIGDAGTEYVAPLGFFAGMGADILTFFIPTPILWWIGVLPASVYDNNFWGDGSNSLFNYIGFSSIGIIIVGLVIAVRRRVKLDRYKLMIIFVGVAALILSLGPVIKFNSQQNFDEVNPTTKTYILPDGEGVKTPLAKVITKVPGLKQMRAVYRWHILTMFMVVLASLVVLDGLYRHRNLRPVASLLLAILLIEMSPNLATAISVSNQNSTAIKQFDVQVIQPLSGLIEPGSDVLYFPNSTGGNDYLANYITPRLGVMTPNVGNDKALSNAKRFRSETVGDILSSSSKTEEYDKVARQAKQLVLTGKIDYVVIPKFDLRWDSYAWPPISDDGSDRARQFRGALVKNGAIVQEERYFYIFSKPAVDTQ